MSEVAPAAPALKRARTERGLPSYEAMPEEARKALRTLLRDALGEDAPFDALTEKLTEWTMQLNEDGAARWLPVIESLRVLATVEGDALENEDSDVTEAIQRMKAEGKDE